METYSTRRQRLTAFPQRSLVPVLGGRLFGRLLSTVVALVALALPAVGVAQAASTGTVTGQVSNKATGQYLLNAEVTIVGTDKSTVTTQGGRFSFEGVPAGAVKVAVKYTGLDPTEQTVTVAAGQTATADFPMTSAQYADVVRLDAFEVSSAREGNAKAIVDQKQASNIQTSIAADAFGTVSEDNVGEFLKYMSGLSIDYNENDARQVRVRGLSAKYANVTIDGNPVASADFGIATGRSFQFEQVSLATIDTIDLNKTPLADQSADSLAGTINVKSKSAFNQMGRRIHYSANATVNEFAKKLGKTMGWDNREHRKALLGGNVEFSDTFMGGKLGLVAGINHTGTYVEQKIIANLARTFDSNAANNETEIPQVTQVNWQDGLKPTFRDAVLINLDYRLRPEMVLSLRTSYNYYDAPFHNRNWTLNAATGASQVDPNPGAMTATSSSATDTGNTAVIAGTNFRKYGATFNVNPALNWQVNRNLNLDASLAYSRSYQWYDSDAEGFFNIVSVRMRGVSWGYTSTLRKPNLQLLQGKGTFNDTRSFFDLSKYDDSATAQIADRNAKDQSYSGRVDLTMKLPSLPVETVLKFGVNSRMLVKDISNHQYVWSMNVIPAAGGIDLTQYRDPYTPRPAKRETLTDVNGVTGAPPSLDKWRLYDLFTSGNTSRYTVTPTGTQPFTLSAAQAATNFRFDLQNMWDLEETINAAYVMATVRPAKQLHVIAGLRYEGTDTKGRAFDDIGGPAAVAASGTTDTNNLGYIAARYGSRRNKTQSYNDLFPSMQLRFAPRENLVGRLGYYRSILRPDVQNISRSLVINDTSTLFTTANPNLKPEYANNLDARLEYYFEPVGVFSAGIFTKKIQDIQYTTTTDFTLTNVPQDILDLGYTPASLVASSAQFARIDNGPSTTLWGYEFDYSQQLSFLRGVFGGLGVFANYSYTQMAEEKYFTGASGVTKETFNVGLNLRARAFVGQVKFNWVGDRLLSAPGYTTNATTGAWQLGTGSNAGRLDYEAKRLQIDINADYKFSPRATLFLNIANLTGAPSVRYGSVPVNLIRHGGYGAKYTLGVKGSF